jgi:hypothetical protein
MKRHRFLFALLVCIFLGSSVPAFSQKLVPSATKPFHVLAFYTAKEDLAHIHFVHDANKWFAEQAKRLSFTYDSTNDWSKLNGDTLARYDIVLFLDTRPEAPEQREAFQEWMEGGGSWIGFHFSAFALTPSAFNQDWDWYHETFLGAGQYVSNTWHPTAAVVQREHPAHPAVRALPDTFRTAPNEWYRWEHDLRKNPDIQILLSIHPSSFPLGNGPKAHEIWHEGYYPVAWTNKKFRMVYMNMGHDDMDYDGGTNRGLSSTFSSTIQNKFLLDALFWLGGRK